jgi:hypothetical protein
MRQVSSPDGTGIVLPSLWTSEIEELMQTWGDKALCYKVMHERAERYYYWRNVCMTLPVIILSGITGTATFAVNNVEQDQQKNAQMAIGAVTIVTGIISTIGNFFRFANSNESHKVSAISWGKFHRQITIELKLNPADRSDCLQFLKACRVEQDRLIEQSPPIPEAVVEQFKRDFGDNHDVHKPEIANGLEPTRVYGQPRTAATTVSSDDGYAVTLAKVDAYLREGAERQERMLEAALTKRLDILSRSGANSLGANSLGANSLGGQHVPLDPLASIVLPSEAAADDIAITVAKEEETSSS